MSVKKIIVRLSYHALCVCAQLQLFNSAKYFVTIPLQSHFPAPPFLPFLGLVIMARQKSYRLQCKALHIAGDLNTMAHLTGNPIRRH